MQQDLHRLQRRVTVLTYYTIGSTAVFLFILLAAFSGPDRKPDIIRTRGIVIEDSQGRDRILIGSPVPASPDRMRTNPDKVREKWAPNLGGEKYMEQYAGLDHTAEGILFLTEDGYDKFVLGEKTPDPNTGRRIVDAAGFTFNDDRGFELGGLGVSRTESGEYRVVLGMDDPTVGEALHLFVLEDGTKGMRIAYEDGQLFLGRARPDSFITGKTEEFSGIMVMDGEGKVIWEKNALKPVDR